MRRLFCAGWMSLALALGAIAPSPALAGSLDDEETQRVLTGLALFGLAAFAIHELSRDDDDDDAPKLTHYSDPDAVRVVVLPDHCLQRIETAAGHVRLYRDRCMHTHFHGRHTLPERCLVQIYARGHVYDGYRPACLRDHGYRVAILH